MAAFVDVFGEELIDVCASVCKVTLHIRKVGFVEVLAVLVFICSGGR